MQLDKNQIIEFLRSQGDQDKAQQAEQELPQQVDTDRDSSLLTRLGLDPQELIGRLTGGGDLGGIFKS
jgi:hypothetical protein